MKKIKAVALSDLHFGDTESLLYQDDNDKVNIIGVATDKIAQLPEPEAGKKGEIEELILMGDIADLSESDPPEMAYKNLNLFMDELLRKVNVGKVIYVIGNHDHHLWVDLMEHKHEKEYHDCPNKTTTIIQKENDSFFNERFGGINANMIFAYPNYVPPFDNSDASFFFHHGHFLSDIVIKGMVNKGKVDDLEELENRATWDMEFVWWELKKLGPIKEKFYDLVARKLKYFFETKSPRGTTFADDAKPIADENMLANIIWYLQDIIKVELQQDKQFHFVYGHTHQGGRLLRDDRILRINGKFINVWNTGGWIVPSKKWSPDACIFYIEEKNENGKKSLIPSIFKIVAFAEGPHTEDGDGDFDRSILSERLKKVGQ